MLKLCTYFDCILVWEFKSILYYNHVYFVCVDGFHLKHGQVVRTPSVYRIHYDPALHLALRTGVQPVLERGAEKRNKRTKPFLILSLIFAVNRFPVSPSTHLCPLIPLTVPNISTGCTQRCSLF